MKAPSNRHPSGTGTNLTPPVAWSPSAAARRCFPTSPPLIIHCFAEREPDGAYIIGEFKSDKGELLPIA